MNAKRSLQNRIRGWLPQEPHMISTRFKVEHENKQPLLMIPPEYKISATKVAGAFAVFWIILYGFMFFTSLNLERYPISGFQVAAWVIAGLGVGTISCAILTKNQLSRLSKDYQTSINLKDMVLLAVPIVLLCIFGILISRSIGSSTHIPYFQGLTFSIYAWGVSCVITRVALFASFEKRENMRIMQGWLEGGLVLIPKPPNSDVNRSEAAAKQELPSLSKATVRA